jgi:uncharacterized membrane protein YdfJ with MMPL/SSD domain
MSSCEPPLTKPVNSKYTTDMLTNYYVMCLLSFYTLDTTHAIEAMLSHAGHVISVSGLTLIVSFGAFIFFPINILSSSGLACVIALSFTLIVNLTLTPALLYQFNGFFQRSVPPPPVILADPVPNAYKNLDDDKGTLSEAEILLGLEEGYAKSFWFRLAKLLIRPWIGMLVILLTVGFVIPFSLHANNQPIDAGVTLQLLPRGSASTTAFQSLVKNIGGGFVFPYRIIVENTTHPEFAIALAQDDETFSSNFGSYETTRSKVSGIIHNLVNAVPNITVGDFATVFTQDELTNEFFYGCNKGMLLIWALFDSLGFITRLTFYI